MCGIAPRSVLDERALTPAGLPPSGATWRAPRSVGRRRAEGALSVAASSVQRKRARSPESASGPFEECGFPPPASPASAPCKRTLSGGNSAGSSAEDYAATSFRLTDILGVSGRNPRDDERRRKPFPGSVKSPPSAVFRRFSRVPRAFRLSGIRSGNPTGSAAYFCQARRSGGARSRTPTESHGTLPRALGSTGRTTRTRGGSSSRSALLRESPLSSSSFDRSRQPRVLFSPPGLTTTRPVFRIP